MMYVRTKATSISRYAIPWSIDVPEWKRKKGQMWRETETYKLKGNVNKPSLAGAGAGAMDCACAKGRRMQANTAKMAAIRSKVITFISGTQQKENGSTETPNAKQYFYLLRWPCGDGRSISEGKGIFYIRKGEIGLKQKKEKRIIKKRVIGPRLEESEAHVPIPQCGF